MTTSKWEMLERENKSYNSESIDQDSQDDDINETRYFNLKLLNTYVFSGAFGGRKVRSAPKCLSLLNLFNQVL